MPNPKKARKPTYLKTLYWAACEWHWFKTGGKKQSPEMKKLWRAIRAFERADSRKAAGK
jgi:hypothetical protein